MGRVPSEPGYAKVQGATIGEGEDGWRARPEGPQDARPLPARRTADRTARWSTVDDPRFDPMWEACGALGLPVAIHIADPEAFFLPIDRFNERYEELANHPDWSFHGPGLPVDRRAASTRATACSRAIRRRSSSRSTSATAAENLALVGERLDKLPNMHVEIGARIGELGRQPRASRQVLRQVPGPDPVRHRRGPLRHRDAAAGVRRRALPASTTASSRPRTSTSTTPRRRCRRRAAGASTASACPKPILRKVYHDNALRALPTNTAP